MRYNFIVGFMCLVFGAYLVSSEQVTFEKCKPRGNETVDFLCTINEVRVDPCKEAEKNKACKIVRGKSAGISFDFTPGFNAEHLIAKAFWKAPFMDLEFIGMDNNACTYTTCPVVAGQKYTYTYNLDIAKKFPPGEYPVKWRIFSDTKEPNHACCFLFKIKLK